MSAPKKLPDFPGPLRRDRRYPHLRELSVTYEGSSEQVPLRPPDISPHGMFINTPRAFPESAVVAVRFRLTRTGREIQARGEVRYCLPGVGVGIEFVDISEEDQQAIEDEVHYAEREEA